jgi:phosphatidylethanolamine N-methyltransferase
MAHVQDRGSEADGSHLRERPSVKPLHLHNSDDAKKKVLELNQEEEKDKKDDESKKTYGRTPDGTGKYINMIYQSVWEDVSHAVASSLIAS